MNMKKLAALVMALVLCLMAVSAMAATEIAPTGDLQAAVNAGGEIKLVVGEYTVNSTINVPAGVSVTLDLNDFGMVGIGSAADPMFKVAGTLTVKNGSMEGIDCFKMLDGGTLTLESDFIGTAQDCVVYSSAGDHDITVTSKGTLNATGEYSAIQINGGATGMKVSVSGTVTAKDVAIYFPCQGTLDITDATITGKTAVEVRGGTVTVKNSTLTATGSFSERAYDNGTTTTGVALAVSPHTTKNEISVSVENSALSGKKALYEKDIQQSGVVASIEATGGSFEGGIEVNNAKADLYQLPTGTTIVKKGTASVTKDDMPIASDLVVVPHMTYKNDKLYKDDLVFKGSGTLTVKSTDELENAISIVVLPETYMEGGEPLLSMFNVYFEEGPFGTDAPKWEYYIGDASYVNVTRGSIQVNLQESFLKSLAPGRYVVFIDSIGGHTEGTFTVAPAAVSVDLPSTGDNSSLMLWASMLALAVIGFAASKKVRFN